MGRKRKQSGLVGEDLAAPNKVVLGSEELGYIKDYFTHYDIQMPFYLRLGLLAFRVWPRLITQDMIRVGLCLYFVTDKRFFNHKKLKAFRARCRKIITWHHVMSWTHRMWSRG